MSLRVFAWDANPNVDRHLYPQSNRRAAEIVASGRGEYIQLADGRTAVQLKALPAERAEKSIGSSNLVPFGRAYNPMMQPPSIQYEIPRAGDCRSICTRRYNLRTARIIGAGTKSVLVSRTRKVSARKIDFTAIPLFTPTHPRGVIMSHSNVSSSSLDSVHSA